jgi:hypothetical protein
VNNEYFRSNFTRNILPLHKLNMKSILFHFLAFFMGLNLPNYSIWFQIILIWQSILFTLSSIKWFSEPLATLRHKFQSVFRQQCQSILDLLCCEFQVGKTEPQWKCELELIKPQRRESSPQALTHIAYIIQGTRFNTWRAP